MMLSHADVCLYGIGVKSSGSGEKLRLSPAEWIKYVQRQGTHT